MQPHLDQNPAHRYRHEYTKSQSSSPNPSQKKRATFTFTFETSVVVVVMEVTTRGHCTRVESTETSTTGTHNQQLGTKYIGSVPFPYLRFSFDATMPS